MTDMLSGSELDAYAGEMRQKESSNNYSLVNSRGYMGAYQMQTAALEDAGFQDEHGQWTSLAKSMGVTSDATFLANHKAQDRAFGQCTDKNFGYLKHLGALKDIGSSIDGTQITLSGLLAGAHLVGIGSEDRYLKSHGAFVPYDGSKPPVSIATYIREFAYPETWLSQSSKPPIVSSDIHKTALSAIAPLDDLANNVGQGGVSISAPVKQPNRKPTNAHAQPQANPDFVGMLTSNRSIGGPSETAVSIRKGENVPAPAGKASSAAIMSCELKRAPSQQGPSTEQSSRLGIENLTEGLSHTQLLAIGSLGVATGPRGSTGRSSPAAMAPKMGRRTTVAIPVKGHAENGLDAGADGIKIRAGEATTAVENDILQAAGFVKADLSSFDHAFRDFFMRQARLPPAGGSGFDPRVTPAWPGVKVPV